MWIPSKIAQLNYADMQKLGCKLSADEIYHINKSCLKDAIFQLQSENGSGFCTGEIVSKQGLLFTNHHCGYEAITKLSTTEHNYLDNGFWAKSHAEELSCPGIRVTRVVRIEDVTAKVLENITDKTSSADRKKMTNAAIKKIEEEAIKDTHYEAAVSEMYQGGEYYLFVYEAFGDVRLVGTPPSGIGKFGGDTDNWIWPRHTGDFSIFRVYMAPDGKPTKSFDKNNVPYKPLHSLPISINGVKEGDFTMIMGYPGQTERFLSSYGMVYKRDFFNKTIVNLFDVQLKLLKEDMDSDINIKLAYADTYAGKANGHKMWQGETNTLKTTDAIQQKEKLETNFTAWVEADQARKQKYGDVLKALKKDYEDYGPITESMLYLSVGLLQGSEQTMAIQPFKVLEKLLLKAKDNKTQIDAAIKSLRPEAEKMFAKYYKNTDRKVFSETLKYYIKQVPAERRNSVFANYIFKDYKAKTEAMSIDKFIEAAYTKSIFTDKSKMMEFLDNPKSKVLVNDPMYKYLQACFVDVFKIQMNSLGAGERIAENERKFIEGLREFQKDKVFYADANSTLRLTYGTVQSYNPRDGVHYKYLTYVNGILEKEDPNNDEFVVPKELKEKILNKQFGRYADETGNLPVCFLSDNDITGGNSGSPIINGKGELIGLAFDGNWEWLCSNLLFNKDLQRTINVDARYVLWVIDEVYGAKNIIAELEVVKN